MTARDAVDPRDALRDALAALPDLASAIGQDAAQREARRRDAEAGRENAAKMGV